MLWEDLGSIASRILVPLNAGAVLQVSANNVATSSMWFANNVSRWGRNPGTRGPASSCDVARCVALWGDLQRFPWLRQNWRWPCGRRPHSRDHTIEYYWLWLLCQFRSSDIMWQFRLLMSSYDIMYAWCSSGRLASRWCFSPVFALAFPSSEANESQ